MRCKKSQDVLLKFVDGSDLFDVSQNMQGVDKDTLLPKLPAKFSLAGHRAVVNSIAFHPSYSLIASCSDDAAIKLWDFETGQFERTLKGHTGAINHIAFDPNGKSLATASSDLTIKVKIMKLIYYRYGI